MKSAISTFMKCNRELSQITIELNIDVDLDKLVVQFQREEAERLSNSTVTNRPIHVHASYLIYLFRCN